MKPTYTITDKTVTVIWEGKPHTVKQGNANFEGLRKTLEEERWEDIPKFLTVAGGIEQWAGDGFTVQHGNMSYDGDQLPSELHARVVEMASQGESPTNLLRFWRRLQLNPSYRSVEQLFPFLVHQGIPIDEDGCFLAYKGVKDNYKDCHSGMVDNSPGTAHEMPRNRISDDPRTPCHEGFHVGAYSYASGFGPRVVICKVDPMDVVCVPYDNSQQKMRVCKYKVLGNYGAQLPSTSITEEEIGVPTDKPVEYSQYHQPADKPEPKKTKTPKPKKIKITGTGGLVPPILEKPKRNPKRKSRAVKLDPSVWKGFDDMSQSHLLSQSLDALRKYATHVLKIVGASKIPGGKPALVTRIVEIRG